MEPFFHSKLKLAGFNLLWKKGSIIYKLADEYSRPDVLHIFDCVERYTGLLIKFVENPDQSRFTAIKESSEKIRAEGERLTTTNLVRFGLYDVEENGVSAAINDELEKRRNYHMAVPRKPNELPILFKELENLYLDNIRKMAPIIDTIRKDIKDCNDELDKINKKLERKEINASEQFDFKDILEVSKSMGKTCLIAVQLYDAIFRKFDTGMNSLIHKFKLMYGKITSQMNEVKKAISDNAHINKCLEALKEVETI